MPTPPANQTFSTFQLGTWNAQNDTWTQLIDLNQPTTGPIYCLNGSPDWKPGDKYDSRSSTMRAMGERILQTQVKNGHWSVQLTIRGATTTAILATIRTLTQACEQTQLCIRYAPPGATLYTYWDVRKTVHNLQKANAQTIIAGVFKGLIEFECYPAGRGDRTTLQNLAVNPGFQAPSGPGVQVFGETFASVSAYNVVGGSAPTLSPANTYVDIVMSDSPIRYYRLDEASGLVAYDISGNAKNATNTAVGITYGVAAGLSGDTDTCYTLNGTSGFLAPPVAGLPSGNATWTMEAWIKFAANPAANAMIACFGTWGTSKQDAQIYIDTTGHPTCDAFSFATAGAAALSTGVWHHVAGTYDGNVLRIYADGSLVNTSAASGGLSIGTTGAAVGANNNGTPALFFPGQLDEVAYYNTQLLTPRILAHYNAGHTGATGTVANSMSVAASSNISFGSPSWGAPGGVQNLQYRFRWLSTMTAASFYLHFTDANNYTSAVVSPTLLRVNENVAASVTHIASSSALNLVHEAWYWLQITQFPSATNTQVYLQATLFADNGGVVGAQLSQIGGKSVDGTTALVGVPHIAPVGAALALGGATTSTQAIAAYLFGPGGWLFVGTGTQVTNAVPASGAWEQTLANTYPGGATTSFGAARIDVPPAGTYDAQWHLTNAGGTINNPPGSFAIPCAQNQILNISVWAKSSGLGANARTILRVAEYNSSGVLVGSAATILTQNGNIAAWTQLQATYTILGATTAYLDLMLRTFDNTASESANGTIWFDNVQVFNQTTTGMTSMPYCELRFPQSPAQLLVTGLLGDAIAPAFLQFGTFVATLNAGQTMTFAIARKAAPGVNAQLVTASSYPNNASTPVLDANSYGGFYATVNSFPTIFVNNLLGILITMPDTAGLYHLLARMQSQESAGNLSKVQVQYTSAQQDPQAPVVGGYSFYNGPVLEPFTLASTWQPIDLGYLPLPNYPLLAVADQTKFQWNTWIGINDTVNANVAHLTNWHLLLPYDAETLLGTIIDPTNYTNEWLWFFNDALTVPQNTMFPAAWQLQPIGTSYQLTNNALPNPTYAIGGLGNASGFYLSINPSGHSYLRLDPTTTTPNSGGLGVNQFGAYLADNLGTVLPFAGEVQYSPLYLYPR